MLDGARKAAACDLLRKRVLAILELATISRTYLERQSALHVKHADRQPEPLKWDQSYGCFPMAARRPFRVESF